MHHRTCQFSMTSFGHPNRKAMTNHRGAGTQTQQSRIAFVTDEFFFSCHEAFRELKLKTELQNFS